MLRPRIIPNLLVHKGGLVKTVGFKSPKYVGDPLNAVRIFNEKETDELMVSDIDATVNNSEPDLKLIAELASECRMPLCYSGGVKHADQAREIIGLGVEKVAVSSAAIADPDLISRIASQVGRQSVVVVLDVLRSSLVDGYELVTHNAVRKTGLSPFEFARIAQNLGAGEIVINSVDNDGAMKGYDYDLAIRLRKQIRVPLTVLGGAGSLADISHLFASCGLVGAGAGSLFVFKGTYRAVLINYPSASQKRKVIDDSGVFVDISRVQG